MKSDKIIEIADRVQALQGMVNDLAKELKPYMSGAEDESGDDDRDEGDDLYKPGIDDEPQDEDEGSEESEEDLPPPPPLMNRPKGKGDRVGLMIALLKKKRGK